MNQEIGIALSALGGSLLTYLGLRAQLRDARRKDAAAAEARYEEKQRQLSTAELTYMVKLQEMLVESGQRLMLAQAEHTQREIVLEREKYHAEEELKREQLKLQHVEVEHKQSIQVLTVLNQDQDLEIRKYIAHQDLFMKEISRLNKILEDNGIPVVSTLPKALFRKREENDD